MRLFSLLFGFVLNLWDIAMILTPLVYTIHGWGRHGALTEGEGHAKHAW